MPTNILFQVSCMPSTGLTCCASEQLTSAPGSCRDWVLLMSPRLPHASFSAPLMSGLAPSGELLGHASFDAIAFLQVTCCETMLVSAPVLILLLPIGGVNYTFGDIKVSAGESPQTQRFMLAAMCTLFTLLSTLPY